MAHETRRMLPEGNYEVKSIPLAEINSGESYYGVDCLVCDKRIPLFTQPQDAVQETKLDGPGHILTACQHCGSIRLYEPRAVSRRGWP